MVFTVTLKGGTPWGLRIQGGREFNEPIRIAKINPNSKAYNEGVQVGDYIDSINGQRTKGLEHQEAQKLIKAATDELVLELTRVGSKSNGTMNGDLHNHLDHDLEILNSGETSTRQYKPVSFNQSITSPPTHSFTSQQSPMTVTVNTKKAVRSRTAPASPVLLRQYRTAPTSPVMFQSVLRIPPLSPRSTHKAIDTDDLDPPGNWQATSSHPQAGPGRSLSMEDGGWSLPIKVESAPQPSFGSPPARNYNVDPPKYGQHGVAPPPRDFAQRQTELPREIPVVVQGISEGLRNLRQIPIEVEPRGQTFTSQHQGQGQTQGREVPPPGREQYGYQSDASPARRQIPIEIRQTTASDLKQFSDPSQAKPESPRQIRIERDKRAELEKKRKDLERDINDVIFEAIKQVPVYNKPDTPKKRPETPKHLRTREASVEDEIITPTKVEDQRQKRVDHVLQQNLEKNKMESLQKKWEMDVRKREMERRQEQEQMPSSFATLPIKKSTTTVDYAPRPMYDSDAGSYSTLPSFRQKKKVSQKLPRSTSTDQDIYSFSDVEGGRGKGQPSWRQAVQSHGQQDWPPCSDQQSNQQFEWTPSASPGLIRKQFDLPPPAEGGPKPFGYGRVTKTQSPSPGQSQTQGQGQTSGQPSGHGRPDVPKKPQVSRGMIPIKIHYEQKPKKVGDEFEDSKDSSLSSFDTMDTTSSEQPKVNGIHQSVKPGQKSATGIWSPGMQHSPPARTTDRSPAKGRESPTLKDVPPVWAPGGFNSNNKKEYRPIKPDFKAKSSGPSPVHSAPPPKPEESFAWKPEKSEEKTDTLPTSAFTYQPQDPGSSGAPPPVSSAPVQNGLDHPSSSSQSMVHVKDKDEPSHLPPSQSPYITLLQKNRENGYPKDLEFVGDPIMVTEEGKIPKGAIYLGKSESMEGDVKHTDTYYAVPTEEKETKTTTIHSPKRYEDIGPLDEESGMPLAFRQNVDETKQHDWYKQMYRSLHKTKKKEGVEGITELMDEMFDEAAANNYKPTYQFPAEDNSDSKSVDASTDKSPRSEIITKSEEKKSLSSPLSSSSIESRSPSAINKSNSKPSKSAKTEKNKVSLQSVSESLRRDAKYPSGKEVKSDDEKDINPYRPSYELTNRSLKGEIDAGYRSEPEYRSKMRSKSTSNVGKTARAFEWSPPNARSNIEVYRNQPRSIIDYEPGFSSIAFRESKTQRSERPKSYTGLSPAERQKEASKRKRALKAGTHNPPVDLPGQFNTYTEGRKRLVSEPSLKTEDGIDGSEAYKQIQKGGDIPIKGLQKPAPEKAPKKTNSQQNSSPSSPNQPIKPPETNHQPITKSHTYSNQLNSQPIKKPDAHDKTSLTAPSVYRTNGPVLSGYIPNPPVRNQLKISIPSSKPSKTRSSQSAAEQLGVKSPPPMRTNGVDEDDFDSFAFRHPTTDEVRSQYKPSDKDRRRKEEEEAYRKRRLEQIYEEERRKKIAQQQADIESRKHSDFLLSHTNQQPVPSQKSPIPNNRFEEPIGSYGVPENRRRGFQIQGKARGLYNFTAQNPRELPFKKGDIIYLIRQVDSNWFEGERNGRIGIFPVNYVEVMTSIEDAQSAAMQSQGQARARYNFNSQTSVELPLQKGEIVTLLRRVDENWFEGRQGNRQGIFPVAYVEVLREPSTPLVTPAPSVICTPMTGRGTPEMLSPVSYDGAPTPPPQPSPGAYNKATNLGYGQKYATSPRDHHISPHHDNRVASPRYDQSPQRYDTSPAHRQYEGSRHMNGGYAPPQNRYDDISARSRQSPQQIRKEQPPSLNISAKSVSTPNINMNSHDQSGRGTSQDEDLALARYRAVYAYKPQNEDELELLEGDVVYVMEKCDDGWYVGTSGRTGMFGTFPGNYVTRTQ